MSSSTVGLVSITPDAEQQIAYCARVSNFQNQNSSKFKCLLKYLIKEGHWSPFEMADMTLQVETTRAISAQIIRHRSIKFQEFSQRYSEVPRNIPFKARRQDDKNRQNSIDDLSPEVNDWWKNTTEEHWKSTKELYDKALEKGIAKECARSILPMSSYTKLYMKASIRDWIHYINLRTGNGTQLEHQEIALKAKEIFIEELPIIAAAVGWID